MAYQASRHKRVQEELELLDDKGNVIHTLHVDLDADVMAKQLSEKHMALVQAQRDMTEAQQEVKEGNTDKAFETIGMTLVDLFEAVFGKEDAKTIVDFYENRYIEMCQEVLPFVIQVVIPRVRSVAQESRNSIMQGYNRKQKIKFGIFK
ncbi:MAG: hypothetical protein K0S18_366 [Anaerocolumna sp.]|jgi:tRNA U54 and U55 pseudouridine synthase Pus10|nr:hypothetical protein [Anaerocolumna sp.]